MNKIDIITTLRLNPWFLNDSVLFGSINVAGDQDIIYSNTFSYDSHNPNNIYFLNSSQSIYINGFLFSSILFIIAKILNFLLSLFKNRTKNLKSVYYSMRHNLKWWSLIVALI